MTNASRAALLAGLSTLALHHSGDGPDQSGGAAERRGSGSGSRQCARPQSVTNEQTIIVTGTRRTNRTVANSPVPVDVIGADADHQHRPDRDQQDPQPAGAVVQLPAAVDRRRLGCAAPGDAARPQPRPDPGPGQRQAPPRRPRCSTSTARSGAAARRSTSTSSPASRSAAIEVLRDGAASQYGSDAIAGRHQHPAQERQSWRPRQRDLGRVSSRPSTMSPNVTGLQTQLRPASRSSIRPTPRYFLANSDGERQVQDGAQLTDRRQLRPAARPARLRQPDRRISPSRATSTAPATTCGPTSPSRRRRRRFDPREVDLQPARVPLRRPEVAATITCSSTAATTSRAGWELYAFGSYGHRNATSAANCRQYNNTAPTATSARWRRTRRRPTPISCR